MRVIDISPEVRADADLSRLADRLVEWMTRRLGPGLIDYGTATVTAVPADAPAGVRRTKVSLELRDEVGEAEPSTWRWDDPPVVPLVVDVSEWPAGERGPPDELERKLWRHSGAYLTRMRQGHLERLGRLVRGFVDDESHAGVAR